MNKKLVVEFDNMKSAQQVADELQDRFEWKDCEVVIENGFPEVRYGFENEDGNYVQRVRSLLDLDEIVNECNEDNGDTNISVGGFNEEFGYVFSIWGKTTQGKWYLGYEG